MSAESNMVRPASRQISTSRVASATSLAPHALKNSLPPPKVPVPRLSTGTLKPEPPSCLYSICSSSGLWASQGGDVLGAPCTPRRTVVVGGDRLDLRGAFQRSHGDYGMRLTRRTQRPPFSLDWWRFGLDTPFHGTSSDAAKPAWAGCQA